MITVACSLTLFGRTLPAVYTVPSEVDPEAFADMLAAQECADHVQIVEAIDITKRPDGNYTASKGDRTLGTIFATTTGDYVTLDGRHAHTVHATTEEAAAHLYRRSQGTK